jgi:hypothetical protein
MVEKNEENLKNLKEEENLKNVKNLENIKNKLYSNFFIFFY